MKESKHFKDFDSPTVLISLPLFHIYGIYYMLLIPNIGGKLVIMRKFDFNLMLSCIEKYKVRWKNNLLVS